jgi:hypothetical protein
MVQVARSPHTWICIALAVIFLVTMRWVPNQWTLLLTNCLILVGSGCVAALYGPVAIDAIRNRDPETQHIAVGICLAWTFAFFWRVLSLGWYTSGKPSWLLASEAIGFMQSGVFLAACYHLTSPGTLPKRVNRAAAVAGVVAVSLTLAVLLVVFEPDTSEFMEALRPYLTSE